MSLRSVSSKLCVAVRQAMLSVCCALMLIYQWVAILLPCILTRRSVLHCVTDDADRFTAACATAHGQLLFLRERLFILFLATHSTCISLITLLHCSTSRPGGMLATTMAATPTPAGATREPPNRTAVCTCMHAVRAAKDVARLCQQHTTGSPAPFQYG